MVSSKLMPRIGAPQIGALVLLLFFVLQCLWFMAHVGITSVEGSYIEDGMLQLDHMASAASEQHSPLVPLLGALPLRPFGHTLRYAQLSEYRFLIRLPFLFAGTMLGASLWYVARRLYGNKAGFIALALYSFSPLMITRASLVETDIIATWGAFGVIFTAIAVAHTLYAPREVVLWNWKRIVLLAISMAICVAAQFSLWILLVVALAFMLWVGHVRRGAAIVIFATACLFAFFLLELTYGFHLHEFFSSLRSANWFEFSPKQMFTGVMYVLVGQFYLQSGLGPLILVLGAIATFIAWKRTRFFGNTAPLITVLVLIIAALGTEHTSGVLFLFVSLPFLILFVSGVAADLLETRYAVFANAVIVGALVANAMLDVYGLLQLRRPGIG